MHGKMVNPASYPAAIWPDMKIWPDFGRGRGRIYPVQPYIIQFYV